MWVSRIFFSRKSIKECESRVGKPGLESRSQVLQLGGGGTGLHSDEACFTILISGAHFPYKVVNRIAEASVVSLPTVQVSRVLTLVAHGAQGLDFLSREGPHGSLVY